jgi:pyrroloquinoline quinone (PQQ) biosynthesis protein C
MRRVKRSKDAVVRALANVRSHGFLDWLRRWVLAAGASREEVLADYPLLEPGDITAALEYAAGVIG